MESEVLMNLFDKVFDDLYAHVNQTLLMKMDVLMCNQIKQVM